MPREEANSVADLLQQARAGNTAARDRLFERCRNYLGILARTQVETWLQAKVDASDIVQQTMLEAHRGFGGFQGVTEGEWLAWLRRILTHNAADFVRQFHGTDKRQARREVPLDAAPDASLPGSLFHPADEGDTPSQMLIQKERELAVADALTRLTPDHREVVILRNLQRLPFDEVARRMNRTRPAVQMLWMRAIHKLQDELGTGI
jgi:RNA polymerase sigma-70 factor (ECF subfamily)